MSNYFSNFPKTIYNNDSSKNNVDTVTNILSKFSFEPSFKNNSVVYYEYAITDGETPEMLAHKFYGDPEKHWILLSLNDIYNPLEDWPIEQRSLNRMIDLKYESQADTANTGNTGTQWARTHTYEYFKTEIQTNIKTGNKVETIIKLDANTYANVITSSSNYTLKDGSTIKIDIIKNTKTFLEYEDETNEAKRKIKILKLEFVGVVEQEMKKLFEQ